MDAYRRVVRDLDAVLAIHGRADNLRWLLLGGRGCKGSDRFAANTAESKKLWFSSGLCVRLFVPGEELKVTRFA